MALRLPRPVDQNAGFGGRQNETRPADLTTTTKRRDADPLVSSHLLAVDLSTHAFEDVTTFVAFLFEEVSDVRDCRRLDWRRANDFGRPADLFGDFTKRRAVSTNDNAWLFGFDDDLTSVLVEIQVGDASLVGNDGQNLVFGGRRCRECFGIWSDGDTFAEFASEVPNQFTVAGKPLWIRCVDHQLRAFVGDIGDGDIGWDLGINLCFQFVELLVY